MSVAKHAPVCNIPTMEELIPLQRSYVISQIPQSIILWCQLSLINCALCIILRYVFTVWLVHAQQDLEIDVVPSVNEDTAFFFSSDS